VLCSANLMSAPEIAALVQTDESHVRKVIHAFNAEGFSALDPDYGAGALRRPRPQSATASSRSRVPAPTPRASR
jgi:transposase